MPRFRGFQILVLATVTSVLMAGLPANANAAIPVGFQDWGMWRHDRLHNGVSAETILGASNASTLKLYWSVNTGGISYTSPAVVYNATLNKSVVRHGTERPKVAARP